MMLKIWHYMPLILTLFLNMSETAKRKSQGKIVYEINLNNDYTGCEDEGEDILNYHKLEVFRDTPRTTAIRGEITFNKPLNPGTQLIYTAYKHTDKGKELAWTMDVPDLCVHVPQKDMPWSVLIDAMNLNPRRCPIPAATYPLDSLRINMTALKATLNKARVGEYEILVNLKRMDGFPPQQKLLACYTCGYKIEEIRMQAEED